jgi:hypothetical protein
MNIKLTRSYAASYQGGDGIDSVFGFGKLARSWRLTQLTLGMMYEFRRCFTRANPQSMQAMSGYIDHARSYADQSLVASFLDVSQYHYPCGTTPMPEPRSFPLQLSRVGQGQSLQCYSRYFLVRRYPSHLLRSRARHCGWRRRPSQPRSALAVQQLRYQWKHLPEDQDFERDQEETGNGR